MVTLNFSVHINATKEKVWKVLWEDETYRKWTSAFSEGSYAESEWKERAPIKFIGPGGNGIYGVIQKLEVNNEMTFRHLGEIRSGQEVESFWKGAIESYYLEDDKGGTDLNVAMDAVEKETQYFKEEFPKALALVKELAEA